MQEESAQVFHLELHREIPNTKLWETVPTELEQTPEGQIRQHLQQNEFGTRYDYKFFRDGSNGESHDEVNSGSSSCGFGPC